MTLDDSAVERVESLHGGEGTADLIEYLDDLPSETDREWELRLTKFVEAAPDLRTIVEMEDVDADHETEFVRFAAFFAYTTYHRRRGNVSKFGRLLREYDEFADHPMFPHLQALHAMGLDTADSYQDAIAYAREAVKRVGADHQGVTHSLATAILYPLEDERGTLLDGDRADLLDEAERNIQRALDESDYPKFKATHGRILALRGEYDEGIRKVHEAIDAEDDSKNDYALRVNEYRTHEVQIVLSKYRDQLAEEQREIRGEQAQLDEELTNAIDRLEQVRDESESKLRDLQTQTLQFLGFFATLLAVIISSIQIATTFSPAEAGTLILVLTGGLLAAFGGFTAVLPIEDAERKSRTMFVMGVALAGSSLGLILAL